VRAYYANGYNAAKAINVFDVNFGAEDKMVNLEFGKNLQI